MLQTQLTISDMHCQKCVDRVTTALKTVDGVTGQTVSVGSAEVGYEPAKTSPDAISQAITKAGYATKVGLSTEKPKAHGCCGGN